MSYCIDLMSLVVIAICLFQAIAMTIRHRLSVQLLFLGELH